LTINEIIEANLNAKAKVKINDPKNPEIVLLTLAYSKVIGNGWFIIDNSIVFECCEFINDCTAKLGKKKQLVGLRVITREVNGYVIIGPGDVIVLLK